ncbi:hypothetical protein VKT23_009744 [Stygiomarasmius scandens]|uniref:Uncharacterized protein n=1 Tax=Marasmiellus scandens TaxID=2682957 RepID=A0ABR1JHY3_9AGAR
MHLRPTTKARFRSILYLFAIGAFLLILSSRKNYSGYNLYEFEDAEVEEEEGLHPQTNTPHHHHTDTNTPTLIPAADTNTDLDFDLDSSEQSEVLAAKPDPEKQHYGKYCPPLKCSYGRWAPRVPQFTTYEEAFQAIIFNKNDHGYGLPDPHPPSPPLEEGVEMSEEEKKEGGKQRVLEMANWVWESDFGDMVPFDIEEFVIRLLRSPGGLFVVGDSLTTQHFMTLRHRLLQASFFLHEDLPHWSLHDHPHVHQYGLDTNHENTHALLSRIAERYPDLPPIPLERAKRPIITHIVDQTLINQKELNRIFRTEMGYVHGHKYTNVEGWIGFLGEMTKPREGEDGVNEDSLVVVTSGAHWSRAGLHGYSPHTLSTPVIRARIEHAYAEMVKTIIPALAPLKQTTVFFRSISPGHPMCMQLTKPFRLANEEKDGRVTVEEWFSRKENQNPDVVEWDWDSFDTRNLVWKEEIAKYEEDRVSDLWIEGDGDNKKGRGAKWVYLDFWEMDLQRGDAHTLTGVGKGRWDCLHYAMPYVHNQWTDMLWHYVAVDSKLKTELEKERGVGMMKEGRLISW